MLFLSLNVLVEVLMTIVPDTSQLRVFRLMYAESIHPDPNVDRRVQDESPEVVVTVTAPPTKHPPGWPKMKQAESIDIIRRKLQCSKCKGLGHNKKTCKES